MGYNLRTGQAGLENVFTDLPVSVYEDGSAHRLRSLGLGDILHLGDLLGALQMGEKSAVGSLVDGVSAIWPRLWCWLSTVIGPSEPSTLTDLAVAVEALVGHPDLVRFVGVLTAPSTEEKSASVGKTLELRHLLHIVQDRYGWADQYIVNDPWSNRELLPYRRWLEVIDTLLESRADERRDAWRRAAFIGWHQYYFQDWAEGDTPLSSDEWFEVFGLGDPDPEPEQTPEEIFMAAEALMAQFGISM